MFAATEAGILKENLMFIATVFFCVCVLNLTIIQAEHHKIKTENLT